VSSFGSSRLRRLNYVTTDYSDGGGAGILELTTTSNSGDTIIYVDVPTGEVFTLNFGGGLLFPKGVYCKTKTNVAGYTLFSDKYSAAGLTAG
jgi:hypothetical protein